jgi:hypothetical protein
MSEPIPRFATIPHWCVISGMSRTATYLALGRRNLVAVKAARRTLIDVDSGLAWLRSLPTAKIRPPKAA